MLIAGGPCTLTEGGPLTLIEGGPLTLIEGTDGVTEIEGVLSLSIGLDGDSLIDIVGTEGVTDMDGAFTLKRPRPGALTEIDGVSCTCIVGIGGAGVD
jgi:hypothetical protein